MSGEKEAVDAGIGRAETAGERHHRAGLVHRRRANLHLDIGGIANDRAFAGRQARIAICVAIAVTPAHLGYPDLTSF
ncbi:hypothetical protein [Sphingobium chlorophenolicum]|uniref:hypothetical protein n=1 Tax=Sphingobium chlorophenolicum TaxID=46429 RepID=UPI00117FCE7A|nr:hypothetical protein [Sphingobium chlorophenolicum]